MIQGLIKIESTKSGRGVPLFDLIYGAQGLVAEYAPLAINISNDLTGQQRSASQDETLREMQEMATYMNGGYILYADDLNLIFHNKQTDSYNGVGGNTNVRTNLTPYRELKFKTTITERDSTLPTGMTEAIRNRSWNPLDYISQAFFGWLDSLSGTEQIKAYYKYRQGFLRDLDDVEIVCSSTMFAPLKPAYITASQMNMSSGSTDATFDINIKEVSQLGDSGDTTTNASAVEPGTGFN